MGRRRVKLALIANESARKVTYKKRREGMMKKVSELTNRCGVEACVIMYKPDDPNSQPETWPSSPMEVEGVLNKLEQMPQEERSKRMVDQETYLREKVMKAKETLRKKKEEVRVKEMTLLMHRCLEAGNIVPEGLGANELNELEQLIEVKIKEIDVLIEEAKEKEGSCSGIGDDGEGNNNKGKEPMVDGNNRHYGLELLLDAMEMEH